VGPCTHFGAVRCVKARSSGCTPCLRNGDSWAYLLVCLTCGQVGCSDDSTNRHAMKHYEETDHPIVTSRKPGEAWRWCYVDQCHV
jgi:monovalent cation:H+ antiporter-2, CPA2 family